MEIPNDGDTLFWMLVGVLVGMLLHWGWMHIRNMIDDRRAIRVEMHQARAEAERERLLADVRRIVNGEDSDDDEEEEPDRAGG